MTESTPSSRAGSTAVRGVSPSRMMNGMRQFIMFGVVGGSGTIVNLAVIYLVTKIAESTGTFEYDVFANLFGTRWNVRYYHVFMIIAFLVANTWNYQLNRMWTFKGISKNSWLRGFLPFLATGLVSLAISQVMVTLLMNPTSPIALPAHILDNSSGIRRMFYWASAISIVVAMPVNFVINKFWAFRRPGVASIVDESDPH